MLRLRVVGQLMILGKRRILGTSDRYLFLEELMNEVEFISVKHNEAKRTRITTEGPRYALESARPKLFSFLTSGFPREIQLKEQKVLDDKTQKFYIEFSIPPSKKFVKLVYQKFKDAKWRGQYMFGENEKTGEQFFVDCMLLSIEYDAAHTEKKKGLFDGIMNFLFGFLRKRNNDPKNVKDLVLLVQEFFARESGQVKELKNASERFDRFVQWFQNTQNWKEFKRNKDQVRSTPQNLAQLLSVFLDIKKYLRRMKKEMRSDEKWSKSQELATERKLNDVLAYLDECNGFLSNIILTLMNDACGKNDCDQQEMKLVKNVLCIGELNENYDPTGEGDDLFDIEKKKEILKPLIELGGNK
jgi:hypothetical protein